MASKIRILLALLVLLIAETFCTELVARIKEELEGFAPGEGGSPAMPEDPTPTIAAEQEDGSTGSSDPFLRPVCFLNTGTTAATVMAWTYLPPNSTVYATPSSASTVAFPGGNSSACLSLPFGSFTWCYHWELGDMNDDGYIEYSHAVDNRVVLLDVSDPKDLDLAEKVSISVPPGLNEFPGVCPLQGNVIRWGNQSTEWRVELEGGIVVGGSVSGTNYYTWTINSGTFDGVNLYFQASTTDAEGCKSRLEAWWTVTAATVSSVRVRDSCGTESTEVHTFDRTE